MPRIDPLDLLTCLKVLLAPNGGIKGESEVTRLAGLMGKFSKKLVSKCIYIQILKSTQTDLLGKFMGAGGWSLTHMWLNDAIEAKNWHLVQEILELLLLCPVDVQRLRSNTAPKLVKSLCMDAGNEAVKLLSSKLVEQWLKIVKDETLTIEQTVVKNNNTSVNTKPLIPEPVTLIENPMLQLRKSISNLTNESDSKDSDDLLVLPDLKKPIKDEKIKTDNGLVYKIITKGGKQTLSKVEQQNNSEFETKKLSGDIKMKKDEEKLAKEESTFADKSHRSTEGYKDRIKDKSRNSKDKERDRSSSTHHKSSSKSSSTSKSGGSSSSSSKKSSSAISTRRNSKDSISSSSSRQKDSKSRDRDSEKDRSKSGSSSSNSKSGSSSSSSSKQREKSSSSSSKSKEREREKEKEKQKEKEKEKENQDEKDKDTLSKLAPPSIDKIGKIPRKPRTDESSNDSSGGGKQPTSITIPSKKASISIEIRKDSENRPKTVKTFNSQFRSHGLAEEAPPPPSRKGLKKPISQSLPGTSIPTSLPLKRSLSPVRVTSPTSESGKDSSTVPPTDKKAKIDMTSAPAEKPGAIKLISPKPKPQTLIESDMFMDALFASATVKKDARKRKRKTSISRETSKDGTSPPESPVAATKAAPLKFYQDTLEDKDDEKSRADESIEIKDGDDYDKNEDEDDIPLKRVKEEIEGKVRREREVVQRQKENGNGTADEDEDGSQSSVEIVKKPPGPGCGPDGPPGVLMLHRRKGPKKKLSWRPQEKLEEVRFFELDENERVNVTKTFNDMKTMERFNEREAFLSARKIHSKDIMIEQTLYGRLIMVDEVPPHPEGNQSNEKKIQAEREKTTLKALYFTRQMIPDSPSEPDMEQYQITEPAVIPLDDVTGNPDAVNDFTMMAWPAARGSPPHNSMQIEGEDFPRGPDRGSFPMGLPNAVAGNGVPFNSFMPFGNGPWQMGGPGNGPPNGVIPPNLVGPPMGPFNNINMGRVGGGGPMGPNLGLNPNDIPPLNLGGPNGPRNFGPNFGPNGNQGNFNNFGGPGQHMNMSGPGPNMNMGPRVPQLNMNMGPAGPLMMGPLNNMNNGPGPMGGGGGRGGGGGGGGGWHSGPGGPSGPGGNNSGGGGNPNWIHNNRGWSGGGNNNGRICKAFQRGFCRNGKNCQYVHSR